MPQQQYRPYLTLEELKLLSLAVGEFNKSPDCHHGPDSMQLQVKLSRYIEDIELVFRKPSYTSTPRPTILDKLGFGDPAPGSDEFRYLNNQMTEAEERAWESTLIPIKKET